MAHRRPLHALERWAYDTASMVTGLEETKTQFTLESIATHIAQNSDITEDDVLAIRQIATQMVFAADCISGRAQIAHVPEELYDDVCKSEFANDSKMDPHHNEHFPWPMFAIELNNCESHLAIVVSSFKYLWSRAEEAQSVLGIENDALKQLLGVFCRYRNDDTDTVMTLIPAPVTCKLSAKQLVDNVRKNTELTNEIDAIVGHDRARQYRRQLESTLKEWDTNPYPSWPPRSIVSDDTPKRDETLNLITFVMADNVKKTKVYEPPDEPEDGQPKKKKKRKRCRAHIYEVGVTWSKSYKTYREATKSSPQGGHKRPHIRRGHFHRFRVGPRDGEARYVTYWIPPTLVGDIERYKPSNQGHIIGSRPEKKKRKKKG